MTLADPDILAECRRVFARLGAIGVSVPQPGGPGGLSGQVLDALDGAILPARITFDLEGCGALTLSAAGRRLFWIAFEPKGDRPPAKQTHIRETDDGALEHIADLLRCLDAAPVTFEVHHVALPDQDLFGTGGLSAQAIAPERASRDASGAKNVDAFLTEWTDRAIATDRTGQGWCPNDPDMPGLADRFARLAAVGDLAACADEELAKGELVLFASDNEDQEDDGIVALFPTEPTPSGLLLDPKDLANVIRDWSTHGAGTMAR